MSELAFSGQWRRAGLILRPIGVTAEDRFGDVMYERRLADFRIRRILATLPDRTTGDAA